MSFDWPEFQLSEKCTIKSSTRIFKKEYVETGIPFMRSKDVIDKALGVFSHFELFISKERYQEIKCKYGSPNEGDLLISSVGNRSGWPYIVQDEGDFYFKDGNVIWMSEFDGLDPDFLAYWLKSDIGQSALASIMIGSAQKAITIDSLRKLWVSFPPLEYQQLSSDVLKLLDKKIASNKAINQTLEEMAQAIFQSWFVDFDPVKSKMNDEQPEGMDAATASLFPEKLVSETGLPEGWIQSEIGDEVTVVGGGTPSKKIDDFWVDGDIHWTSPKDLSGVQDKVLLDTASKVTEAGLRKISSGLLPIDTVLLSSRAPVGYLALAKVPMAINQGYIAMKCEKQLPPEFVLQWCVHRMDEIKQRASGSTFAEISKKSFKPISVVVPTDEVLSAYQKLVKPLYDAITSNARQNEQLSTLRDTLLPKLLSGEIKLEEENNLTGALA